MSQAVISVASVLSVSHFLFCGFCQSLYSAWTCPRISVCHNIRLVDKIVEAILSHDTSNVAF